MSIIRRIWQAIVENWKSGPIYEFLYCKPCDCEHCKQEREISWLSANLLTPMLDYEADVNRRAKEERNVRLNKSIPRK